MQEFIQVQLRRFFNPDRDDAERRYAMHRTLAYEDTVSRIKLPKRYQLAGIGYEALKAFEKVWQPNKERKVKWDWMEQVARWKRTDHSRLELAVWHDKELCGLMVGKTSKRKTIVYVLGIEGAPYKHPLKGYIIPIALEVAEAYATSLGAKELRLDKPAAILIARYQKLGYTLRFTLFGSYMTKKLGG